MNSLTLNNLYSEDDLLDAGFTRFPANINTAVVFIKDGSVFFFSRDPGSYNTMKLIHSSSL